MTKRYTWRDLIGEPPLCEGGRLASIVFCCDPRRKMCPVRDEALKMLGLKKKDFVRAMEEHKIEIPERDGTCYGNLAFCPSPEKPSKDRDEALLRIGWGLSRFLMYKFEILKSLVPPDRMDYVFATRVLRQFAVDVLDLEEMRVYRGLALGNIKTGTLVIQEIFKEHDLKNKHVETLIKQTEFVGVRIPKDILEELDDLVAKGVIESRSDGIRRALLLYLGALRGPVKQEAGVKR